MPEPQYKAASLVSVRQLLREGRLEEQLGAALDAGEGDRYRRMVATDWVPVSFAERIYSVAAPLLYPNEAQPARTLGRTLAHQHLRGIYRFVLRFATVPFVMQQTARLWRMYNDTGALDVELPQPRCARAVLIDYPDYPPTVRETLVGYIGGTFELTGAKDVKVNVTEDPEGRVAFHTTWR